MSHDRGGTFTAVALAAILTCFGAVPGHADTCRPLADRLSDARTLLNGIPPSTPLRTIPRAIMIWFRTDEAGVNIPSGIRSEYPTDMAIVLEHRYRNLLVTAEAIVVTASFKGAWETVSIPWNAVISVSEQKAAINIDLRKCP